MSLLAALVRAYDRLPDAPAFGYSSQKVGFCILLTPEGSVAEVIDLRGEDRKRSPRILIVPQAVDRTVAIAPNFMWDKSAYVLGVTAGSGKRTADEHAKFRARHLDWLEGTNDRGLNALRHFLENWVSEGFLPPLWPEDLQDQNIVFALVDEYQDGYLHDRPAAKALWQRIRAAAASEPQICLVTGEAGPVARLHPPIKGVRDSQTSGARIVSFNLDAFSSYGHDQGNNAPVSEAAAFAYTTTLNRFLMRDSGHRIQIGDASTVFWADASAAVASEAKALFSGFFEAPTAAEEDSPETKKIAIQLERLRKCQRLEDVVPELAEGVRFYVLGLSPNAARLSVRFYWEDDFGALTGNYQRFLSDMAIEPAPRDGWPPFWRYLRELAVLGKSENVPPNLAGDWMRAILSGTAYPLSLLTVLQTRIRADGEINALRVAMLRAVLIRNLNLEVPVALDPANTNKGYLLGRLFAAYEEVQRAALGKNVNATIKDKYYGSAAATPQRVFAALGAGAQNHFAKLRKADNWQHKFLDQLIMSIMDLMEPGDDPIPVSLSAAEQALFAIGYYHQRSDFFRKRDNTSAVTEPTK